MQEHQTSTGNVTSNVIIATLWVLSLITVGFIGFIVGQNAKPFSQNTSTTEIAQSLLTASVTPIPSSTAVATPVPQTTSCAKSGYDQKWDYLVSYEVKEKDTPASIATEKLGNDSRANEVIQLNGIPLVVGSTIYLPPDTIKKSNGYLKQVHGKLISRNESSWHLSFNNDEKGRGILIPSYWFNDIAGKDNYQIGDCLTVLFDEGYKVFTLTKQ